MKKTFKRVLSVGLCAGLCVTALGAAACKSNLDPETRPLQLSTQALDQNFNPFFYTSLPDSSIIGMTQISLLTNDSDGNLVCGEDWATAALAKRVTMYDSKTGGNVTTAGSMDGRTEYEIVLKNGIKFSDGKDLTIKDVLFNLYVYLDPAYTGSATLYSMDIQGLNAYRTQRVGAADGDLLDVDASFRGDAQTKISEIVRWSTDRNYTGTVSDDDLDTIKRLFDEEIKSDWTAIESSWSEAYKDSYRFTSAWEAYLFQEGIITVQTKINENGSTVQIYDDTNNNGKKDDGELYYTTLDADQTGLNPGKVESQHIVDSMNAYVAEHLDSYMSTNNCDAETATAALQKESCIKTVYDTYTIRDNIYRVLSYWSTGNEVLQEFIGEARSDYFDRLKEQNGGLAVEAISGISTYKTSTFTDSEGKEYSLGGEHDVLKVVINGIDPKAEYNLAFPIAPLHYYSGRYHEVDYVAEADGVTKFGVDMGNKNFYDTVVQSSEKNGIPVGAGPYKASTKNDGEEVTRTGFCDGSIVYFERNDKFETVGKGIENAKIKKLTFKTMNDDQIVSNLKTNEIDYGEPNATPGNQNEVNANKTLKSGSYSTGGYGYIGINPKYVPEVDVRRAIMKAMDVGIIIRNYYGSSLATQIHRPMSTTSWAYPENAKAYDSVKYTTDDNEIIALVEGAGYTKGTDGIYVNRSGNRLKYTFTIAGESTDHPAYAMFLDAADRLNKLGFEINVGPNVQALRLMNSGSLAVWAAAYSSASDPDMYQVYHKDSKATSVNNWNYSGILNDRQGIYSYELEIVNKLSEKIDDARETLVEATRKSIYAECLDLVMDLAVELPTYQRNDLYVFNSKVIKEKSLNLGKASWIMGPIAKIWEVEYV